MKIAGEKMIDGVATYTPSPSKYHSWDYQNEMWIIDVNGKNKITEINKLEAEKKITEKYPIYKQLNILRNGTIEEKTEMGNFIDDIRKKSNEKTIEEIAFYSGICNEVN